MARPCIHHQLSSKAASHPAVHYFLSCRAHPRSGSVQTSPTSTPMSGRRGRQLPQLPPTGKDRSKFGCFWFCGSVKGFWGQLKASVLRRSVSATARVQFILTVCFFLWWLSWLRPWKSSGFTAAADSRIRLLTGAVLLFADGVYNDRIFADLCYTGVYFCLPSITSLWFLFHFSLRRWRRRNRALWRSVPECPGLVFQTGGAGWGTPHSGGQNHVCNSGWLGSLATYRILPSLNPSLCCSCWDVLCSLVLTLRPVWTLLLIVAVLGANVVSLCYLG